MGLPFTQYQPVVSCSDVCEAGLGEVFASTVDSLVPAGRLKKQTAEAIAIEVRGIPVALDEEASFSYYRFLSLQSPVYSLPLLPKLARYAQYCQQQPMQVSHFSAAVEKALKRRALHDFMQDMLPAVYHVPILRLSVYDSFSEGDKSRCLADILAEDDTRYYQSVADFVSLQIEELDTLFLADY